MLKSSLIVEKLAKIQSERFVARQLDLSDVTLRYLSWFNDVAALQFIQAAKYTQTLEGLRVYVQDKRVADNALLLGIFANNGTLHIGNIKFEPIDFKLEMAVVGILIGDPDWRGKGVFKEVFLSVANTFQEVLGIHTFWLGVSRYNQLAIKAYKNSGFTDGTPPQELIPKTSAQSLYFFYNIKHSDAISLPN